MTATPLPESSGEAATITRPRAQVAELRKRIADQRGSQLTNDLVMLIGIELDDIKHRLMSAANWEEVRALQGEAGTLRRLLKYLTERVV